MAYSKVILNNATLMDVTDTTAVAGDVAQSKYFYLANGVKTEGTSSGSGGGGASKEMKDVNFFDYDGTIVESYTAQEAAALTELPANPTHEGLTAQGWNYTLAEMKEMVTAQGQCDIGQMYITSSGDTEIDVTFDNPNYLSPYLALGVTGTITVDWGDSSETSTITGGSVNVLIYTQHVYPQVGDYTITIHVNSGGGFSLYNNSTEKSALLSFVNTDSNRRYDRTYSAGITAVRIGESVSFGNYPFSNCTSLKTITIPYNMVPPRSAFENCFALKSLTIPSTASAASLASNVCQSCYSLASISIPLSITNIMAYSLNTCGSLKRVVIPNNVWNLGNAAFNYCKNLKTITIPSSVTTIGTYLIGYSDNLKKVSILSNLSSITNYFCSNCFELQSITIPSSVTSIGNSAFFNNYSLKTLTIPSGVTNIAAQAFSTCYAMEEYHFLPTTPPTLANTNVFSNIQSGAVIYVPSASLEAYQTADVWSTYASYMQGE